MDDINTWRARKYLRLAGYESENRRVTYTGAGVIEVGMMNDLSWLYGPTVASEILGEHVNFIAKLGTDKEFTFLDYAITSSRDDWAVQNGKTVKFSYLGDSLTGLSERQDYLHHSMKICPVGRLIFGWATALASVGAHSD